MKRSEVVGEVGSTNLYFAMNIVLEKCQKVKENYLTYNLYFSKNSLGVKTLIF